MSIEDEEEPRDRYIIAPVGIAVGRVETGILQLLKTRSVLPHVIYLVTNPVWTKDLEYVKRYVEPLLTKLKSFERIVNIEIVEMLIDDFDEAFTGIFQLISRLISQRRDVTVYLDCTSAPKTWLFACRDMVELFRGVRIYYVNRSKDPKYAITFADYDKKGALDPGGDLWTYPSKMPPNTLPQTIVPAIIRNEPAKKPHKDLLQILWMYERDRGASAPPVSNRETLNWLVRHKDGWKKSEAHLTRVSKIMSILEDAGLVIIPVSERKRGFALTEKGLRLVKQLFGPDERRSEENEKHAELPSNR